MCHSRYPSTTHRSSRTWDAGWYLTFFAYDSKTRSLSAAIYLAEVRRHCLHTHAMPFTFQRGKVIRHRLCASIERLQHATRFRQWRIRVSATLSYTRALISPRELRWVYEHDRPIGLSPIRLSSLDISTSIIKSCMIRYVRTLFQGVPLNHLYQTRRSDQSLPEKVVDQQSLKSRREDTLILF